MNCVPASPFNGRLQTPWYSSEGLFFDPPTLAMENGEWRLSLPSWMSNIDATLEQQRDLQQERQPPPSWPNSAAAFCPSRFSSNLAAQYERAISQALDAREQQDRSYRLAACIMEPVLQGAGGMQCIDPAFQHVLAKVRLQAVAWIQSNSKFKFLCR